MWTKLDDHFLRNRKLRAAGKDAAMLYLAGLLHCSENLTDGIILDSELPLIAPVAWIEPKQLPALVARLETPVPGRPELGLWERVDGGYRIHDFLEYNPSAESIKEERRRSVARQAQHKKRRRSTAGKDDVPTADRVSDTVTHAVSHAVSNAVSHAVSHTCPVPVPSRTRPVPVPVPVPEPAPSVTASGTDEASQVLSFIAIEPDATASATVAKTISDHPDTDPVAVALEYMRWQERRMSDREADHAPTRVDRDRLKGWSNAVHRAAARGYYRRAGETQENTSANEPIPSTGVTLWDAALEELTATMGAENVREWFMPLSPSWNGDDVLVLEAPSRTHRDWLEERFAERVGSALNAIGHGHVRVQFSAAGDSHRKAGEAS